MYYLKKDETIDRKDGCEAFRKHFGRYTELIKTLIHQSYIPGQVFSASSSVVAQMQEDVSYWFEMCKLLFAGEYEKIDYKKGEEIVDVLLMNLAAAEMSVKIRLEELSKLS